MSNKVVAIIEHDALISHAVEHAFQLHGFEPRVLRSGDAVEFVREAGASVVLLSAEADGEATLDRLRAQSDLHDIPIIMTSSESTSDVLRTTSGTTADAVLVKPFSSEQLLDAVARVMPKLLPAARDTRLALLVESPRRTEPRASTERDGAPLQELLDVRQREIERARKAREELLEQVALAEDRISSLELDVRLGAERVERLEREKRALAEQVEASEADRQRALRELEARLARAMADLEQLETLRASESERLAAEVRDLVDEAAAARGELSARVASFTRNEEKLHWQVAALQDQLAERNVHVETLTSRVQDQTKDAEHLRREIAHVRAQSAQEEAKRRELIEGLERRGQELQAEGELVERALARVSSDRDLLARSLDETTGRATDLDAELADARGQIAELSLRLEASDTRAHELGVALSKAQQRAADLTVARSALQQRLEEATASLAATTATLQATASELDETQRRTAQQARDFEAHIAELEEQALAREQKLTDANKHHARAERALQERELTLEALGKELEAERSARASEGARREERIAELEQRAHESEEGLEQAERAHRIAEAEIRARLEMSNLRAEERGLEAERATSRVQELEPLVDTLRNQLGDVTNQMRRAEASLGGARDDVKTANARIEALVQSAAEQKERAQFVAAELLKARAEHEHELQQQQATSSRALAQARERADRLEAQLQSLKADSETMRAALESAREQLQNAEERSARFQQAVERDEREKSQLAERLTLLGLELENAQAKSEQLDDEVMRLRATARNVQAERDQLRKEKTSLEERLSQDMGALQVQVDMARRSANDGDARTRDELEAARRERDEAKDQVNDIRRRAEALQRRVKEIEAQKGLLETDGSERAALLASELMKEREARARDAAAAKAADERWAARVNELEERGAVSAQDQVHVLQEKLQEREERLARVTTEFAELRAKAKRAIANHRAMQESFKASGGPEAKEQLGLLRDKYNDAVNKLKAQASANLALEAKYKELAEKYRDALPVRKVARGEAPRGEAPSGEATVLILESGDRKLRTLESDTPPQHVEVARSAAGRRSQGR